MVLLGCSGHRLLDLSAYDNSLSGKLIDYPLPEEELKASLQPLSHLPKPQVHRAGRW